MQKNYKENYLQLYAVKSYNSKGRIYRENENFIRFGNSALKHSEYFHWDKVVKKHLKLINN